VPEPGVLLKLFVGRNIPLPAPLALMDSLVSLEVTNNDRERDGFQLVFRLGKGSLLEYGLLKSGILDPPSRVVVSVVLRSQSRVLIDGFITNQQISPSNDPGRSTLTVTGEDLSLQLDLEEKNVPYPNLSDSNIVRKVLSAYAHYGIQADVRDTRDTPPDTERIPSQQVTDLALIQRLAERNGFIFFIEPGEVPGQSTAYWGPENREGRPQKALNLNFGPDTNILNISVSYDSLGPAEPQVKTVDSQSRVALPLPSQSGVLPNLSSRQDPPLRRTIIRDSAKLSSLQASLRSVSAASRSSSAVTATGELDAVRYGNILQARRLVSLRGVGETNNGNYYVRRVVHRISRGEYRQSFTLEREGRGASSKQVAT
jgi:phage protein D